MLRAGTIIGDKYRLCHLIANGGMAEVYLAEHIGLEKNSSFFALKRLLPRLATLPIFAEMFVEEASLASSLRHKNIVICHELIREQGDLFMAMEFIVGKEIGILLPIIRALPLIERTKIVIAIGLAVCEALRYLHSTKDKFGKTIVHGDVSPQNIMVTAQGVIKLYDFGAVRNITRMLPSKEEIVRGNLRYMSPEHSGAGQICEQSDLFSLSLVLLELLAGDDLKLHRIKAEDSFLELQKIKAETFIDNYVFEFFVKGLSYNLEQRFINAYEMFLALENLAKKIELKNQEGMLKDLVASGKQSSARRNYHRVRAVEGVKSFLILTLLILGFGGLVWAIVIVGTEHFEPTLRHKIPHWSENIPVVKEPEPLASSLKIEALTVKKKKSGTLSFFVKPWAEIFIDGKFIGSTPLESLSLPEGNYLVHLRNPDLALVALKMVKIYAEKKTELVHNF